MTEVPAANSDRQRLSPPDGSAPPSRVAAWCIALCVVVPACLCVAAGIWFDVKADRDAGRYEQLLAEGAHLSMDGRFDEAEACFRQVLDPVPDPWNAEAVVRLSLLASRRGIITTESVSGVLEASDSRPGRLPPGFADFVRAELRVLDGEIKAACSGYEHALAHCDERLREDVCHAVDHVGKWGATERFCLTMRITTPLKKNRYLKNIAFRPYADSFLTIFACTPSQRSAQLLFPHDGAAQEDGPGGGIAEEAFVGGAMDVLNPAGAVVRIDCNAIFGKQFHLFHDIFRNASGGFFGESGIFFCVLATPVRPDRGDIRARLAGVFRSGGAGPEALLCLEETFGAGRAALVIP